MNRIIRISLAAFAFAIFAAPYAEAQTVTSITVTPNNPGIAYGTGPSGTQQFTATATLSDKSTQDVTASTTWSSSNSAVATISNASGSRGLATSSAVGSSLITAIYSGHTATARLWQLAHTQSQIIQPSTTGTGINLELSNGAKHYVAYPDAPKPLLVVFLGGTGSVPSSYTDLTDRAAGLGFGAIDLRYLNSVAAGSCTTDDNCYRQLRGEVLFGQGVRYGIGSPYDSLLIYVNQANSVVNRLVNLLDCLAYPSSPSRPQCANSQPSAYWTQFLVSDSSSPYTTSNYPHGVVPNWSKIILAGHSQGGGNAAYAAVFLADVLHRDVMFSAPDDSYSGSDHNCSGAPITTQSASWIRVTSTTPMSGLWGVSNFNEGIYGSFATTNWCHMSDGSHPGVGNPLHGTLTLVDDGASDPLGSQQLQTNMPNGSTMTNHFSTAVNGYYSPGMTDAWDYLLTGNGAD